MIGKAEGRGGGWEGLFRITAFESVCLVAADGGKWRWKYPKERFWMALISLLGG